MRRESLITAASIGLAAVTSGCDRTGYGPVDIDGMQNPEAAIFHDAKANGSNTCLDLLPNGKTVKFKVGRTNEKGNAPEQECAGAITLKPADHNRPIPVHSVSFVRLPGGGYEALLITADGQSVTTELYNILGADNTFVDSQGNQYELDLNEENIVPDPVKVDPPVPQPLPTTFIAATATATEGTAISITTAGPTATAEEPRGQKGMPFPIPTQPTVPLTPSAEFTYNPNACYDSHGRPVGPMNKPYDEGTGGGTWTCLKKLHDGAGLVYFEFETADTDYNYGVVFNSITGKVVDHGWGEIVRPIGSTSPMLQHYR